MTNQLKPKVYKVACYDYDGCNGTQKTYCDNVFTNYQVAAEFSSKMNKRFENYIWPRYEVEEQ